MVVSPYYIFDASTDKFLALKRFESGDCEALWHVWDDRMIASGELSFFTCFIGDDVQSIEDMYSYIEDNYPSFLGLFEIKMDDLYIIHSYFRESDGQFVPDFSKAYR